MIVPINLFDMDHIDTDTDQCHAVPVAPSVSTSNVAGVHQGHSVKIVD